MPATAEHAPETQSPPWPAYKVKRKPIGWLKAYERNARTHSEKQVEQLRASLRQFGWTTPILAREDGTIIAGHGRVEAARAEGFKQVPVIIATGWSEDQCRAYTLIDNQLGLNSAWDDKALGAELASLNEAGIDLAEFGLEGGADGDGETPDTAPQLDGLTYSVVVRCKDEAHQGELLAQLETQGLTCEALIS